MRRGARLREAVDEPGLAAQRRQGARACPGQPRPQRLPHPQGMFRASFKSRGTTSAASTTSAMPYAVFFNGGIAFHQGDVVSRLHGCIRLEAAPRAPLCHPGSRRCGAGGAGGRPPLSVLRVSRVGLPFPGTGLQNRLLSVAAHWTEVANGTARGCPARRRPRRNGSRPWTVLFALDGRSYEIDLSEDNAAKLRASLAAFVAAARRSGGSGRRGRTARYPGKGRAAHPLQPEHTAAIRTWARENGTTFPSAVGSPRRRRGVPGCAPRRADHRRAGVRTRRGGASEDVLRAPQRALGMGNGCRSMGDPIRKVDRRWRIAMDLIKTPVGFRPRYACSGAGAAS